MPPPTIAMRGAPAARAVLASAIGPVHGDGRAERAGSLHELAATDSRFGFLFSFAKLLDLDPQRRRCLVRARPLVGCMASIHHSAAPFNAACGAVTRRLGSRRDRTGDGTAEARPAAGR